MSEKLAPYAILLLILAAIPPLPTAPPAHAQGSAVVFVDPSSISDLSKTSGTTVDVRVNVSDAPSIAGFAVWLSFNESVIDVATINFSTNVLASIGGSLIQECVDAVPIGDPSGGCYGSGPGSIVVIIGTTGNHTTTAPTSGLLFETTFNVRNLGVTQLLLSNVALANGRPTTIPVSTVDGYFTNIDCPAGGGTFCTPPIANFTSSPPPLYTGTSLEFNASSSRATSTGASVRFYMWNFGEFYSSYLNVFTSKSAIAHHSYGYPGSYTVTLEVNDTYGITAIFTKKIIVVMAPPPPDFTIDVVRPFGATILVTGHSLTLPVQLASLGGFSGAVNLTANSPVPYLYPPTAAISVSLGDNSLSLGPESSNSTYLVLASPSNGTGSLHLVNVTGSSGLIHHSFIFQLNVQQPFFSLSCYPTIPGVPNAFLCQDLTLTPGSNTTLPIYITSVYGFSGNVSVSAQAYTGVSFSLNRNIVELGANQTMPVETSLFVSLQTPLGVFPLSITGRNPAAGPHSVFMNVDVESAPLPPDFSIQASTSVEVTAGENTTFQIQTNSLNGLSGIVVAGAIVLPQLPGQAAVSISPDVLVLGSGHSNYTQAKVTTTVSTLPGNYFVALLMQAFYSLRPGGPRSSVTLHSMIVNLHVFPPPTPPAIIQLHWKRWVSLSKSGLGAGTQTFVVGVANPNNSTTIYAQLRIQGVDGVGNTFVVSSRTLQLFPGDSLVNIRLIEPFNQSLVGHSFQFAVSIEWGNNGDTLIFTSNETTGLNSGEFTVIP